MISSLRQASIDLQRLQEEKEYLMTENIGLKQKLGIYDTIPKHPLAKSKSSNQLPPKDSMVASPPRDPRQPPMLNYVTAPTHRDSSNRENVEPPDELSLMIQDYKSENQRFSQRMH